MITRPILKTITANSVVELVSKYESCIDEYIDNLSEIRGEQLGLGRLFHL